MKTQFEIERKLIGEGKVAKVYLWNGFAYKCFRAGYPAEYIDYERRVQDEICKTGLCVPRYYESEFPSSIKMDLVSGVTLADRMRREKYKGGLEDLFGEFLNIHKCRGLDLPPLKPFLISALEGAEVGEDRRARAISSLEKIADGDTLCHLDYHFLNLMYEDGKYQIIDWVSAKNGNPIFDYARTYVIMYEFAFRLAPKFLKMVKERMGFDEDELREAIFIMAIHRLTEYRSEKILKLVEDLSKLS